MINLGVQRLAKLSAILLLGFSVAGAPALAAKGGNGNGKSGDSGNAGRSDSTANTGNGKPAKLDKTPKIKTANVAMASRFGKLNGFMHASPKAIAKASPNSAIGKVAKVYAGLLDGYLVPVVGQAAPTTIDQLAQALAAAANKPLTADVIVAINAKLMAIRPDLAAKLTASGKTSESLATEIAAALAI